MLPATLNALGTHTPLPERPLGHDRGTPSVHSVVPGILLLRWRLVVLVLGLRPVGRRLVAVLNQHLEPPAARPRRLLRPVRPVLERERVVGSSRRE